MINDLADAIKAAVKEPKAPQSLVEKTVAMAVAMEKSRAKTKAPEKQPQPSGPVM